MKLLRLLIIISKYLIHKSIINKFLCYKELGFFLFVLTYEKQYHVSKIIILFFFLTLWPSEFQIEIGSHKVSWKENAMSVK